MGSSIIDRRKNDAGKSTVNKRKFLKRIEGQIKKAIPDIVGEQGIKDIASGKGKIKVPIKGIKEPRFRHSNDGGKRRYVHPGNKKYAEGEKVRKPPSRKYGDKGRRGSNDPTVEQDEFAVILSREEFLHYFFEDLELPDMIKRYLESAEDFRMRRAGFTQYGIPSRLNIVHSYRESLARRIATESYYKRKIAELEEELKKKVISQLRKKEIEEELEKFKKQLKTIPHFDDFDLRYNNFEKEPIPVKSAVMFCH